MAGGGVEIKKRIEKAAHMGTKKIKLGCELMAQRPPAWLRSARLGLLSNQASVTHSFEHVSSLIPKAGGRLSCLFSPQHGFFGDKQANMIESEDAWSESHKIPIYSLYGSSRQPSSEMLQSIDILLIDLQDVGTRVYTYGTTMGLCLEQAAKTGTKVVVLDRPNPINGKETEGNVLREDHRSFVGRYPIPMRHGLTMGELARFIVSCRGLECDLEVIALEGWSRADFFPETDLDWVFPSPNMPSFKTALLYPGMVLFEGTNISEGRGTTLPFELFGAPFLDQQKMLRFMERFGLEGVLLRPVCFEPTFDKWRGNLCNGFQIHVTDREKLRPYRLGLCLLQAFLNVHPEEFRWLDPPYEYEREKLPISILLGNGELRQVLEEGKDPEDLEAAWMPELEDYGRACRDLYIYE